jgi:hypothetical protein
MGMSSDQTRRQAIVRALSQRAGNQAGSAAIAAAALALHIELAACLSRIVGGAGVDAISRRCVLLTQREFPWLRLELGEPTFAAASRALERQPAAAATDAAVALLDCFCLLLTNFIGAGLTMRLLRQAWPDIAVEDPDQERPQ